MSWYGRAVGRLRLESSWRCVEPVVVIESDDWGLERNPCTAMLSDLGQPTDWADEATETPDDVEALTELLGGYRDELLQPACVTANFVMTNPDYERTRDSKFEAYEAVPIDVGLPSETLAAYRRSIEAGCFLPQHHGLRHFSPRALLRDLKADTPHARKLFDRRAAMGLSFLKGQLWRYHSEYEDWNERAPADRESLAADLRRGLDLFERCFGFRTASTIPPHYLWTDAVKEAIRKSEIRIVQGAGYRLSRGSDGQTVTSSAYLGQRDSENRISLTRTVSLEPRPGRPETAERAIRQAARMFEMGIPVVVDTHRINYTGVFRHQGLSGLRTLLDGLAKYRPRFLSTEQLGEAIASEGAYTIRGGSARLTPVRDSRVVAARMATAFV